MNNTDGLHTLEETLFAEYPSLRRIYRKTYSPTVNSLWIVSDESITNCIIFKYDRKRI